MTSGPLKIVGDSLSASRGASFESPRHHRPSILDVAPCPRKIAWRNGRDSNPRAFRPAAFKATAIVRSATVPLNRLPGYTPWFPGEVPERPNGAPC